MESRTGRQPLFKLLDTGLKLADLPLTAIGNVRGRLELLDNLEHPFGVGDSLPYVGFQLLQIHSQP